MKTTQRNDIKPQSYCIQVIYGRKSPREWHWEGLWSCGMFCSSKGDHQEGHSCIVDTLNICLIDLWQERNGPSLQHSLGAWKFVFPLLWLDPPPPSVGSRTSVDSKRWMVSCGWRSQSFGLLQKPFLKFSFNHSVYIYIDIEIYLFIALEKTGNADFSLEFPSWYVGHQDEVGASSGRMLMQHREPAWALFFTWEKAEMSFRRAIKATEQLPRFVVMISGFHSSKYPWNSHYGLWISSCLAFLEISSLQIKVLNPQGDQKVLVSIFRDFFFFFIFWGVRGIPAPFLGIGKKRLGICLTDQPPVFSMCTWPFLTTW